ncbi:hypothetical protein Pmar_PMAR025027 [Perkinsus marinus ATCC 50983]|uniref:Uncharacterized protein n=1 Tax=Perkinsus marinus (strain ATCC 50983 / TXsc) TaxID=423536 RepID=C5KZ01_PERM5|nr:hypothetical protein Pmar_PMAR025027 [Perkinsus marinus ATCC 50983]EER10290.1 hypothetical protein Pmar_PMAR025027 [Perkinsus marinus ATCC 50983]|eukprot:XP_002778495.1 hypothetical protein Pmar_PMAR025027 [Perkinsus marinus ATCC 50983]
MSSEREQLTLEEAQAELDKLLLTYDEVGARVLKELPLYVVELEREFANVFSLEGNIQQIEEAFAANECSEMSVRSGKVHPVLLRINRSIMKAAEKAIERVTKYMRWCDDIHHGCKVYHETRAEILRRLGVGERVTTKENYSENGNKISSSKAVKVVNNPAPMGDSLCHLARYDARHYFQVKNLMKSIVNM